NFQIISPPTQGLISGSEPNLIYTSTTNAEGIDFFTYIASDGMSQSSPATVTIQIATAKHPPVANDVTVDTVSGVLTAIQLNGSDPDGDAVTYRVVNQPEQGQVSGKGRDLVYISNPKYSGLDSFTYVTDDGSQESPPAMVSIHIALTNHPPVA